MARTGLRAAAIIIRNNKILLIHRKKDGKEYWVLPGGGVEEGEKPEEAVMREVFEETSMKATNPRIAFWDFNFDREHPYFFIDTEGEAKQSAEILIRSSDKNWYELTWVLTNEVKNLNLVPEGAKTKLLKLLD